MVDVAAQVGDFELGSAQPLAKQVHFGCHHRKFVRGPLVRRQDFGHEFAAGEPVEHLADVAERAKQGHRKKKRQQDRARHRDGRNFRLLRKRVLQRGPD